MTPFAMACIGRKRPTWETPPIIFNENAVEEDGIKMLGLVADKHFCEADWLVIQQLTALSS